MRILFCASGSGGHIYPALRCADEFRKQHAGAQIIFLTTKRPIEDTIFANRPDHRIPLTFVAVPSRGRGSKAIFCLKIFAFLIQSIPGALKVLGVILRERPSAAVGFGGLPCCLVMFWCRVLRIPSLVHEQNVIPGRANRIAGKLASQVAVAYEQTKSFFRPDKVWVSGNPLREELWRQDSSEARTALGLREQVFTILVIGGSQGARFLNERVPVALTRLSVAQRQTLQVMHVNGETDSRQLEQAYEQAGISVRVQPYCRDMSVGYSAADVVISRAGAMTIAELHLFGLPAVLVPYPFAAAHQKVNAAVAVEQGAAVMVEEGERFDTALAVAVASLLQDKDFYRRLSLQSSTLARKDAAALLAAGIEKIALRSASS